MLFIVVVWQACLVKDVDCAGSACHAMFAVGAETALLLLSAGRMAIDDFVHSARQCMKATSLSVA